MPWFVAETGPYEGDRFAVGDGSVVGRLDANAVGIPKDDEASRRHAALRAAKGRFLLVDLDSRNGTRVNGERIKQKALAHGDRIEVGLSRFRFEANEEPSSEGEAESATPDSEALRATPPPARRPEVAGAASGRSGRKGLVAGRRAPPEGEPSPRAAPGGAGGPSEAGGASAPGDEPPPLDGAEASRQRSSSRGAVLVLLYLLLAVLVFLDASFLAQIVGGLVLR